MTEFSYELRQGFYSNIKEESNLLQITHKKVNYPNVQIHISYIKQFDLIEIVTQLVHSTLTDSVSRLTIQLNSESMDSGVDERGGVNRLGSSNYLIPDPLSAEGSANETGSQSGIEPRYRSHERETDRRFGSVDNPEVGFVAN